MTARRNARRTWTAAIALAAMVAVGVPAASAVEGSTPTGAVAAATVKIDVGGQGACSGALLSSTWVITAKSCFTEVSGALTTQSAPKVATTATIGRTNLTGTAGRVVAVDLLVPHPSRDVVLARLKTAVTTVAPVKIATAAPVVGDQLTVTGYGRTSTELVPDTSHAATYTVTTVATSTIDIQATSTGATICKGDAGGPALRTTTGGAVELLALHLTAYQGGCLGHPNTIQGATETRLDTLRTWITSTIGNGITIAAGVTYHQARLANAAWTGFQPVSGFGTTAPGVSKDVAIAALPNGSTQVVIIGSDDVVYHRVRHANGSWDPFQPLNGMGTTTPAKGKRVAIAGMPDGSAHVVIIGADSGTYHRVRAANGSWSQFQPVAGVGTPTAAKAADVAIAGLPDGSAQVVIVGQPNNTIFHRVRATNGTWSEFASLGATGNRVAIAGLPNGSAQVTIANPTGLLFHRVRNANGTWAAWGALNGSGTTTQAVVKDVAIAGMPDGTAQLLVVGADNGVYHRIRAAAGSWSEFTALPARGANVTIAGLGDGSSQTVITGAAG